MQFTLNFLFWNREKLLPPPKYTWLVITACSSEINCKAKEPKVKPVKEKFVFDLATSCTSSGQVIHDTGDWICLPRHTTESLAGHYLDFSCCFPSDWWEQHSPNPDERYSQNLSSCFYVMWQSSTCVNILSPCLGLSDCIPDAAQLQVCTFLPLWGYPFLTRHSSDYPSPF